MPGKSNSEKIDDLQARVVRMSADLDNLEERQRAESDSLHDDVRELKALLNGLIRENAVLVHRCNQFEKQIDESEKRRWQIIVAILTCFFTGFVALIVALLKR